MPTIDAAPGRFPRSTPPLVQSSADGAVRAVVLLDGVPSWGFGAEAAERCREALAGRAVLPAGFDHTHLIRSMRGALRTVPEEWRQDGLGWELSVAAAVIRGRTVTALGAGALCVRLLPRASPPRTLFAPERLVDRLVLEGRLTREEADQHPHRRVICSSFFDGDPGALTVAGFEARDGDRLLLGGEDLAGLTLAAGEAPTAPELRDRLEARGGGSRPAAVLGW